MLDLNYVRENLDRVGGALAARDMPATALDDFAQADAERRRVIAESDALNAERNTASRVIGALMKEGRREEAEVQRKQVGSLKDRIAELDQQRTQTEARMRELLSTLPNIPHESVPVGKDESANVEIRRRSEEHTSELQSRLHLVCRLLLEKKNDYNDDRLGEGRDVPERRIADELQQGTRHQRPADGEHFRLPDRAAAAQRAFPHCNLRAVA